LIKHDAKVDLAIREGVPLLFFPFHIQNTSINPSELREKPQESPEELMVHSRCRFFFPKIASKAHESNNKLRMVTRVCNADWKELCSFIIEHGFKDGKIPKDLFSNTTICGNEKNNDFFLFLLDKGLDPNCIMGGYPLLVACSFVENVIIAEAAIKHGADVNVRDKNKRTPLHVAVGGNKVKMVELLLNKGANVHLADEVGCTPLHFAAMMKNNDRTEVVKLLLNKGASVDVKDSRGSSPLKYAYSNHPDLYEIMKGYSNESGCILQ